MRAVNLIPREAKRRRRLTVVTQLALVSPFVVGSLLVAGYLIENSKTNDNRSTLRALQDELARLPVPTAQPQPNTELALQRDQRISALSAALHGRLAWDRILREISAILPGDVWLTGLSAQSPPASGAIASTTTTSTTASSTTTTGAATPAPSSSPTGPLSLTGYTYSQEAVARLLSRLAVIPGLQDVKLVSSTQTALSSQDVYSFSIQAGVQAQVTG